MMASGNSFFFSEVSTPRLTGRISLNDGGASSYFEIPLVSRFGERDFPISLIVPCYPISNPSFCGVINYLMELRHQGGGYDLHRIGKPVAHFEWIQQNGYLVCPETGETIVYNPENGNMVLYCDGSAKAEFPPSGGRVLNFCLPDGMRFKVLDNSGPSQNAIFLSTEDCGDGIEYDVYLNFGINTGRSLADLVSLQIRRVRSSQSDFQILVFVEKQGNTLTVTRCRSATTADEEEEYQLTMSSGAYTSVSFLGNAASFPESIEYTSNANGAEMTARFNGSAIGKRTLSKQSEWLWTLTDERGFTDYFYLKSISNGFRVLAATMDHNGVCQRWKHNDYGRVVAVSDSAFMSKESAQALSLLPNGVFDAPSLPTGWTTTGPTSYVTWTSPTLPALFGSKCLSLQHYAGDARCSFSAFPLPGEPCLVMALFSPSGNTSTLNMGIDVSYEDGTSEFIPCYETLANVQTPSFIPVACEVVPAKPVAAMAVRLSVSSGPGYVKSVVALRGAGITRYDYVDPKHETVSRICRFGRVTKYNYPTSEDDFPTYSYGTERSPIVTYETDTGLTKTAVDDFGAKTEQVFQTIPPISTGVSKNYRLTERRTETPFEGTIIEKSTYDASTWQATGSESEGVSAAYSFDYQGRLATISVSNRWETFQYDDYRRLIFHTAYERDPATHAVSSTVTSLSYGSDKLTCSVSEPVGGSTVFKKDSWGRPDDVSGSSSMTLHESYSYGSQSHPWSPIDKRNVFGSYYSYQWDQTLSPYKLEQLNLYHGLSNTSSWAFTYPYGPSLPSNETLDNGLYSFSYSHSVGGAIIESQWKAGSTAFLNGHSGFGGTEWKPQHFANERIGVADFAYQVYTGDLKTWSMAMAEEGFYASRIWNVDVTPILYDSAGNQISPSSSSPSSRDSVTNHLYVSLNNASYALSSAGLPKSVISFRSGGGVLLVSCGSSDLSFSSQNGALYVAYPGGSFSLNGVLEGWNALSFGFVSSSQFIVVFNGACKTVSLASPFPSTSCPTFKVGPSGAIQVGLIAVGTGTASKEKTVSYCLLAMDCGNPARSNTILDSKKAASVSGVRVASGGVATEKGLVSAPLMGSISCTNGCEPSFTYPEGIGTSGTMDGSAAYKFLTRPSSFGWSSRFNKMMWKANGQKLSYPIESCADFALKIQADPLVENLSDQRIIVAIGAGSQEISVALVGNKLTLKIRSHTISDQVDFSPNNPIVLCISTTYVPNPYSGSGHYDVAYGLSCSGTISGIVSVYSQPSPGRIHVGTAINGSNPFMGLLGNLIFVPRSMNLASATVLGEGGSIASLVNGFDGLGRPAYSMAEASGSSLRATSYSYKTHTNGLYQTNRLGNVKMWFGGSLQANIEYNYDESGRFASIGGQTVKFSKRGFAEKGFGQEVSYYLNGDIHTITGSPNHGTVTLSYDSYKRLTGASSSTGWSRSYSYSTGSPGFPSAITNAQGTGPTANIEFTYKADLLYSATVGQTTVSYLYDSEGKMVQRSVGSDIRHYVYDGDRLILDSRSDGTDLFYVYDALGNPSMLIEKASNGTFRRYSIFCDGIGRILYLVPFSGTGRVTYDYGIYGEIRSVADTTSTGIGSTNMLCFKGYLFDPLLKMYTLGRRHYDPTVGRFLEPDSAQWLDPKRFGGINPYAYCLNDPITKADRLGTFPLTALVLSTVFGALIAGGIEFGKQTYKGKDFYGIFDAKNWDFTNINTWEIASKALLGGLTGFAMAAGGTVGAAMYGMFKMSSTAMFVVTGIAAGANFVGGVGGYFLHATGCRDEYNVGSALAWGIGQLEKGAIAYVFGLVLGRGGAWKMGPDYGYFGNYKPVGALARIGRDAFARWLVRWPLSLAPNWFADEWFV